MFLCVIAEIDSIKQAKKQAKDKKKREKTVITGDMQGLSEALPLDMLLRDLDKPQASVKK